MQGQLIQTGRRKTQQRKKKNISLNRENVCESSMMKRKQNYSNDIKFKKEDTSVASLTLVQVGPSIIKSKRKLSSHARRHAGAMTSYLQGQQSKRAFIYIYIYIYIYMHNSVYLCWCISRRGRRTLFFSF
ncbi:hypothetical protein, unlikely [Trypanosoma brucei gambiense DAL972]|uniref:Uncharacterized protein n=1 Tax=Trypanosoma brucei gambiense (strain MHOM/CI/86/DAL972) TaxID=679716 RepID=C9ZWW6_TRYB9|nr:hypothetical protein, unlikely [Trypanosoma brucei gambiense DAL972]CBH13905.1 hypothetical protein, unlikely [Trypanosoma brucei gambiense DAL972]|eukprot:XP_011776181.1 hypothetical protein, unlikely [Trypanosoma brucei gambiense DAL972]